MKTKSEIVDNWLERYTGLKIEEFGEYILLTNFDQYLHIFADICACSIKGENKNMSTASSKNITMINFGMGMIIFLLKFQQCPHFHFKKLYPLL